VSVSRRHHVWSFRPALDLIVIQLDRAFFEATVREAWASHNAVGRTHAAVDPF